MSGEMTAVILGVHVVDTLARPIEAIPEGQGGQLVEEIRLTAAGTAGGTAVTSIDNRLRLPLAVVDAVLDVWGAERVGIRISPATTQPGTTALDTTVMETYGTYLDRLTERGLAYTHVIEGITQTTREAPDGVDFSRLRGRAPGAYIANNELGVGDAERVLRDGAADLVSFGRAYIANPDLVARIRDGAPLAEAPKRYWYGGDSTGYSDWPTMAVAGAGG